MRKGLLLAALAGLLWYMNRPAAVPAPARKPLLPWRGDVGKDVVGGPELNGVSVRCDLPLDLHLRNKGGSDGRGGPGTGSGLCVFTSIDMAAQWANVPELIGFRDWMTNFPGGGYPDKVRQYVKKLSVERGREMVEGVDYGQATDADEQKLAKILDGYRVACVTYGYSPRYGQNIAHMVCLMSFGDHCVVLDNNFPGTYEWVEKKEFLRRWKMMQGGWVFWLNAPPPPPVPVNG
jgi:hypothetical protein